MAETGEGAPQQSLTDRQRANLRPLVSEVVLTEGRTANERVRRARERNALSDFDGATAEIEESPSEKVTKARERIGYFGVTHNAQGDRTRTIEEQRRFNRATEALNRVGNFLEQGYERLNQTERNELVNHVRSIFLNNRTLGEAFQRLTPEQQNNQIAAMLQDPEFVKMVSAQIDKVNALTLTSQSDIDQARTARAEAEGKEDDATDTVTRREGAVGRTERSLNNLTTPTTPPTHAPNQFQQALDDARTQRDSARTDFNQAQADYNQAVQDHINSGGNQRTAQQDPNVLIAINAFNAARTARDDASREFQNVQRSYLQAQNVPQEEVSEQDLEARLEQQHTQLGEARIANRRAPEETRMRRIEERELLERRASEENQINRHLENAFSVATREYLSKRVREAVSTLEELEPGYLSEEVETVRKAMGEAIRTRWIRHETRTRGIFRRRVTEQVVSREAVERDFRRLIAEGPNGMLRELLGGIDVRYPGTDENAPTQRLTPDQIRELMGNDLFSDEMKKHYVKNVLANRILTNQIRPAEVHQIMEADWGKGMIKEALAKNTEFRDTITQLTDSQDLDLDKPEFRHRLARSLVDHPGLWLTLGIGNVIHALWKSITTDPNQHLREQVAA